MSRKKIEEAVIDKLLIDMIFCFECGEMEKMQTLEHIASTSTNDLLKYLED